MKDATSGDFIESLRNSKFVYPVFKRQRNVGQGRGKLNSFYGKKHTEESKALMLRFGPKHSDEFKANLSERMKDNKIGVNPKTGRSYSLGCKLPQELKDKISKTLTGKSASDETKAKMSAAQTERWRLRKLKENK